MRSFLNSGGWRQRLPPRFDRQDYFLAAVCALIIGTLYGVTRLPDLLPLDGGEFQVLGIAQGHAHVTGYPVYLSLLRLFALLPLGEPILRATLFSTVMGGVAAGLAYLVGRTASGWRVGGLAVAFAWATSATVWSQAVQAEVYSTASVATAAVLCLVMQWLHDRAPWRLGLAGLIGGVGLGVHGSVPLFAPGIVLGLLYAKIDWRSVGFAVGGAALGLILFVGTFVVVDRGAGREDSFAHVYFPWAEAYGTTRTELSQPSARFWFLVRGTQWKKSMFSSPTRVTPHNAYRYLRTGFHDFNWLWIGLGALGLVMAFKRARALAILLLVGSLSHHLYTFNYEIPDIYVFFIPAYLYASTSAAVAVGFLLDHIRARYSNRAFGGAVAILGVVAAGTQIPDKIRFVGTGEATGLIDDLPSHADLRRERQELEALTGELPRDALVGTNWSVLYRLVHLSKTGGRTDLSFVEALPWGIEQIDIATYRRKIAELTRGVRPLVMSIRETELAALGYTGRVLGRAAGLEFWLVEQPATPFQPTP